MKTEDGSPVEFVGIKLLGAWYTAPRALGGRLTPAQRQELKNLVATKPYNAVALASRFGISQNRVHYYRRYYGPALK